MKQPSKKALKELKQQALQKENWEKVENFCGTRKVIESYQTEYPNPIEVKRGEVVTIELRETEPEWKGWIWCSTHSGQGGWISESYLKICGNQATVLCDYTARELTIAKGESVRVLKEDHGWLWCQDTKGQTGWLPAKNVE